MESLSPEVLDDLRHGRATRERRMAVCSASAHVDPVARAEILAVLSSDLDEAVASRAQGALLFQTTESFIEALKREQAVRELFVYAAKQLADKPGIADAMAQNHNCPSEVLVPIVRHISTSGIQNLLEDLLRLSESPALCAALDHSTSITTDQRSILRELHGPSTPQDEAALAEAVAAAGLDPEKRLSLLQQIGKMNVAARVQFAVRGGTEARRTLIRDVSRVVQRAVLQSPKLSDQEVEGFASMSTLTDEILRLIANNRNFRKNYSVVRNLLSNAKTPLDITLRLLPSLNAQDLKRLTMNKNVPEVLRTSALKLQRTRTEQRH